MVAVRYMLDRQHQEAAQAMTDIELLRFAKSCGLLTDMKPSDRCVTAPGLTGSTCRACGPLQSVSQQRRPCNQQSAADKSLHLGPTHQLAGMQAGRAAQDGRAGSGHRPVEAGVRVPASRADGGLGVPGEPSHRGLRSARYWVQAHAAACTCMAWARPAYAAA